MTYLQRLIHRAAVWRPTFAESETGESKPTYAVVSGMTAVPCLLAPGETRTVQQLFGRDSNTDGICYFEGGTDIKPGLTDAKGANDKLIVTDENGQPMGSWFVNGTQNPAWAGRMIVAGLKRIT